MRFAFASFVVIALGACGGGDSGSRGTDIPFTTVGRTQSSGVSVREEVVARSQSEFNILWARYSARMASSAQPPVIDFNTMQVLGLFLGSRPNGCYTMSITRVAQKVDRLIVSYQEQIASAPGTVCTQALVYPAHLVAVPASKLAAEFVEE